MKASEIRSRFLSSFASKGHEIVPSASLLPHNDPTLYFVNAGMVPFKDVFTGQEKRDYTRATSSQKCLRVSGKHNDLENVGRTPRHHTFFEMLGNFSFGDYFKAEAIPFAWNFLTEEMGIEADRLWVTIHHSDDEAFELWRALGFPESRLQRLGDKDNFWSMGDTGPCGPCTEIHYDHGPAISAETGGPATEDARYVEIWNLVFMQYFQPASGERYELPRPSIDTGMGLERIAAVKQGVYSNYDTDLFRPLIEGVARRAGVTYGDNPDVDTSLRVIADHARATAFLVGDGVMPSNTERGYVLRRIMRRAIRFGVKIGLDDPFMHEAVQMVVDNYGDIYSELPQRADFMHEVVLGEEQRFARTLGRGMRMLDDELDKAGSGGTVSGDVAFTLSDTYGFPLDLTQLIAEERDVTVDEDGYKAALEAQKARGRAAWKGSGEQAVGALWQTLAEAEGDTTFTGYTHTEGTGKVIAIVRQSADGEESEQVNELAAGEQGVLVLDQTPFYGESGGQVGDTGLISGGGARFTVADTRKTAGLHLHVGTLSEGTVSVGDTVKAAVANDRRDDTRRNHTATHLLHAALRQHLGDHVTQKGSLVGPGRLRFDFSHHKPMTADEIRVIEDTVNFEVLRNSTLTTDLKDLDEAKAAGAMALFGEKYDAKVRVVSVPGFSVELCGGTHVRATGDIGLFKITSEGGVAAGVRRLECQTGTGAIQWVREQADALSNAADQLKTTPERVGEAIERLQEERKSLAKELETLKTELAKAAAGDLVGQAREFDGVKVLAASFDGDLKEQADRLRDQLGTSLIVLAAPRGPGKVQLLVAVSKDIAGKRVSAGAVLKELAPIVGGRGGGRPDMAQGGGSEPEKVQAMLDEAYALAERTLV